MSRIKNVCIKNVTVPSNPLIANIGKPLYATQRDERTRKVEEEPAIITVLADVGVYFVGQK